MSEVSIAHVLEFLQEIFYQGHSYSHIGTHRSALSAFIKIEGVPSLGKHHLVSRFMAGVFNLRPPLPRYIHIWDVNVLLQYFRNLGPNDQLSFKNLSMKTICLFSILSGKRLHSLHQLDIRDMIYNNGLEIICKIKGLEKTTSPSNPNQPFSFRAYSHDILLCPVNCTLYYLKIRGTLVDEAVTKFFLTHRKPHNPASKDTLARWVKCSMKEAGINVDIFKPHSVRAASNSKCFEIGFPIKEILKRGNWKNADTFKKFYFREISHWSAQNDG